MVRGETKEQEYDEWLGRIEEEYGLLPEEEQEFREMLRIELGYGDKQIDALWGSKPIHDTLATHGIHIVGIREAWGVEPRYGIQGMPGLWGWERIMEIRSVEGW